MSRGQYLGVSNGVLDLKEVSRGYSHQGIFGGVFGYTELSKECQGCLAVCRGI